MNTEDRIIQKLLEIDEKLSKTATNERVDNLERRIMDQFDKQLVILQRLDQERVFLTEWIRRIENEVSKQRQEIDVIKLKLQIA